MKDPRYLRSVILINEVIVRRYIPFKAAFIEVIEKFLGRSESVGTVGCTALKAQLQRLCWDQLYMPEIISIIKRVIDAKVAEVCGGEYTEFQLPVVTSWLTDTFLPLCSSLFSTSMDEVVTMLLYTSYAKLRGSELFDMVQEFPDSSTGINELRSTAALTDMVSQSKHAPYHI